MSRTHIGIFRDWNGEGGVWDDTLTSVNANTQLQLMFRQVTYTKHRHVTEKLQSHTCYLTRMLDTIQHGAAADNHVRIANRLHLLKHLNRYWVYCFGQWNWVFELQFN